MSLVAYSGGNRPLLCWLLPGLCLALACLVCPVTCQSCSTGFFGPYCNFSCSNCYDNTKCVSTTTGGCADGGCQKGFGNMPNCQDPCGQGAFVGKFGFNCSQVCHCNGSSSCDSVSGNCATGCDPAWLGPGCQTQLPAIRRPPTIASNDCGGIVVTFLKFNASVDVGDPSIDLYRLQTDNGTGGLVWFNLPDFLSVNPDPYTFTLPYASLNASRAVSFRVIAHYVDSKGFFSGYGPASPNSTVLPSCIPTTPAPRGTTPTSVPPLGTFSIAVSASVPGLQMTWNASAAPTVVAYNVTVTPLRTGDCATLTGPGVSVRVPANNQSYLFSGAYWTSYQVSVFSIDGTGATGSVFTNTYTTAEARPTSPVTVSLLGKGTDWLNFTWSLPACDQRLGAIKEYQYFVYLISGGTRVQVVSARSVGILEVPVTGLVPFSVYNITVSYINSQGSSPDAQITVVTDAALGPDPPTGLTVVNVSASSANVTWTPPTAPKAPLADYVVQVTSPTRQQYNTASTYFLLTGLASATAYTVTVTSRSTNGSLGAPSTPLTFATMASALQVASLGNSSRSDTVITVTWTAPAEVTNLALFQVQYTLVASRAPGVTVGASATVNETSAARSRSVSGLQPASQYSLCVTPLYSDSKAGVSRCQLAWTTPAAFAAAPGGPRLLGTPSSATASVNLTASVSYSGGPLTGYVLGVQLTSGPSGRRRRALAPDNVGLSGSALVAGFGPADLPGNFTLGDGLSYGGYVNARLTAGSVYSVRLAAYSEVDGALAFAVSSPALELRTVAGDSATTAAPVASAGSSNAGLIAGLVVLFVVLLAIIAVALFFIVTRVLKPQSGKDYAAAYFPNGTGVDGSSLKGAEPRSADCWSATNSLVEPRRLLVEPGSYRSHASVMSCGTGVTCREEFAALSQGYHPNRPCHRARNVANVARNRSANSLPYDRNLVTFKDPHVYYNACYVDGYIRRQAYISAQSPMDKESAGDFWRMVVEQNVAQIVTLCQEFESKSLHCFRYWPEPGNRAEFSGVQVRCLSEAHRNFYCKRRFTVNGLEVIQYQFLCWPETGVPKSPLPLIALYYAVKVASRIEDGPMLVHCSTALSRTSVFIALDYLLQQAMHEQCVSVYKCAQHLRKARANSLPDQREYAFIYDLLFEAMLTEGRNIVRRDVRDHLRVLQAQNPNLGQTHMWEHFAYLQNYTDRPVCTSPTAGQADRDPAVLPCDDCRVRLADTGVYVNAVWLDGFYAADDTIVTQTPLEATEAAFWTMVLEHRVSHVVDLQPGGDPGRCFYPQPPETQRVLGRDLTLRLQGRTDQGCTLLLECPGAQPLSVAVHAFASLYAGPRETLPASARAMQRAVEDLLLSPAPRTGPTVLVCLNGADRCGLFAACLLAAQQLQHEGFTDVYHLVKWMKLRRPQLLPSLDQYEFVFKFLAYRAKQKPPSADGAATAPARFDAVDGAVPAGGLGETIYSHSQAPVMPQKEPGRVAYHYLSHGDPGFTMHSTASVDLV